MSEKYNCKGCNEELKEGEQYIVIRTFPNYNEVKLEIIHFNCVTTKPREIIEPVSKELQETCDRILKKNIEEFR